MSEITIVRGTTPTILCVIPDEVPLDAASEIWISISQDSKLIIDRALTNSGLAVIGQHITFSLTQAETLQLRTFMAAKCGVRILLNNGEALACSTIEKFKVSDIVKEGVMT